MAFELLLLIAIAILLFALLISLRAIERRWANRIANVAGTIEHLMTRQSQSPKAKGRTHEQQADSGYLSIAAIAKAEGSYWLTICTDASPNSEELHDAHDVCVPTKDLLDYRRVRAHVLEQTMCVLPAIRGRQWEAMIKRRLDELKRGLPGLFSLSRSKISASLIAHAQERGRDGKIRLEPLSKSGFLDWPVHIRTNGTLFGPDREIDGDPDPSTHASRVRLMLRAAGFDRVFISDKEWELVVDDEELRRSISDLAPWRNLPQ